MLPSHALTQINTWFLIAKRNMPSIVLEALFYVSWVLLRNLMYPCLIYAFYMEVINRALLRGGEGAGETEAADRVGSSLSPASGDMRRPNVDRRGTRSSSRPSSPPSPVSGGMRRPSVDLPGTRSSSHPSSRPSSPPSTTCGAWTCCARA